MGETNKTIQKKDNTFKGGATEELSEHKVLDDVQHLDPSQSLENISEVIKKYKKIIDTRPEEVIEFSIKAILYKENEWAGIELAREIIKQKGWNYFFNSTLGKSSEKLGLKTPELVTLAVRACMHKLGSPKDLPIEDMKKLLSATNNDIEWAMIDSHIQFREKVENLSGLESRDMEQIAYSEDIIFWQEEKVKRKASEILKYDLEEYYGLLEELYYNVQANWGSEYGESESPIVLDAMKRWKNMSPEELLEDIYPVFSFNILTRNLSKEEIKKYLLSEEELAERIKEEIAENKKCYQYAAWREEYFSRKDYSIEDYFDSYNLMPILGYYAEKEGQATDEGKYGYALNSLIVPISDNQLALFNPTGELLEIIARSENKEKNKPFQGTSKIMHIAHFMSHRNQLMQQQYNSFDTSLAACVCHWEVVPEKIKKGLRECFEYHNADLDYLLKIGENTDFDGIISIAAEYSPMLKANFVDRMKEFVKEELEKRLDGLGTLKTYGSDDLLTKINIKYGPSKLSQVDAVQMMRIMHFEVIRYMKESINFDLSRISTREFFALFTYLRNQREGAGFRNLQRLVGNIEDQQAKANRIKAFLSLEYNENLGEQLINIQDWLADHPELTDKLFAKYAKMVDGAEKTADEIVKLYGEIFFEKQINKNELMRTILKRAGNLLIDAGKQLEDAGEKDKDKAIKDIIEKLIKQREAQERELLKLRTIAETLNKENEEINDNYTEFTNKKEKDEIRKKMKKEGASKKDIESYLEYVDFHQHLEFNGAIYDTLESYEEMLKREEQHGRFDSQRLIVIIKEMEEYSQKNPSELITKWVEKFKNHLKYQQAFEKKLEQIIFGHESVSLPENYQKSLASDIENYRPELPEKNSKSYLPVGISSRPPGENEIHQKPIDAILWLLWLNNQGQKAELLVADTIQRHNYEVLPPDQRPNDSKAAAIKNGERDRKWYLAVKKVLRLENIEMPEDAGVSQYEERVVKNPEVKKWLEIISELEKESPDIAKAIGNLIEPTIRERVFQRMSKEEEKKQASRSMDMYGKEELAFILALGMQKIGHKKEIRYDMLARIIPIYRELQKRAAEIPELSGNVENIKNRDQALIELSLQLAYFNNLPERYFQKAKLFLIEKEIMELKKQGPDQQKKIRNLSIESKSLKGALQQALESVEENKKIDLVEETAKRLGLTANPKEIALKWRETGHRIFQEEWFKKLDLPEFYYPREITSLSFEVGEKETMNFREPYSTYKGEKAQDLPIEANQMIASTDLLAAAKVMVLSERNQRTYFEKVLRPLITNYYIAVNKSKEEAKKRFQEDFESVATISEAIELVQRKIIWPLEMELG